MFLDDELLEICKDANIQTGDDVQQLYNNLCKKCIDYYSPQLKKGMPKKDVKIILDRTFNLWDSFVRRAIKTGGELAILGELFQEFTFKHYFFSDKEKARFYNTI